MRKANDQSNKTGFMVVMAFAVLLVFTAFTAP